MNVAEDVRRDAETVVRALRQLRVGLARFFKTVFADKQVSLPQYTLMAVLNELGEANMGRLAESMGMTMGGATGLVDKLIRMGHATRKRSTTDRRIVKVKATDEGREKLRTIIEDSVKVVMDVFSDTSTEERETFILVLEKLVKSVNGE